MGRFTVVSFLLLGLTACSTWRGMPTHGGGKRFDEEQRVVAGAIRRAIADMEFADLSGRSVQVMIDSIAQSGGGQLVMPGLSNITGNSNASVARGTSDRSDEENRDAYTVGGTVVTAMDFRPTVFATDTDIKYFEASLLMKLRCAGATPTTKSPEVILCVLVDVLGTNRSRVDSFVAWTDRLGATCELTYYAVEAESNRVLFAPRRTSAESTYVERSVLAFSSYGIERSIESVPPTPLPTTGEVGSAAAPPADGATPPEDADGGATTTEQIRKALDGKLRQADSYIQAGNLAAAERVVNEVRAVNASWPGLDAVVSRLEQLRGQQGRP
jgi:hypothetical protein